MMLTQKSALGKTGLRVPRLIYGTSYLGNLYKSIPFGEKLILMQKWFECTEPPVVIDTAGKYGAGLALEVIGKGLAELEVDPADIVISNKLGWYRIPLETDDPTFETGVWAELEHDCHQTFGYQGILNCFEQGNDLLGGRYRTDLVSVHDPDEYLLASRDEAEKEERLQEILGSYRALFDLKREGKVTSVGIGSKDWTVIRELFDHVPFDWVMFANSFTIYTHPEDLVAFMDRLHEKGVGIINSAVFHGGFLTGGSKFDYRDVDPGSLQGKELHGWRNRFMQLCEEHHVSPPDACLHFGLSHPAISSMALNTSIPGKMNRNVETLSRNIPSQFWSALKQGGLIDPRYIYL